MASTIPFIIGVSGHRDLTALDSPQYLGDIRKAVKECLLFWREQVGQDTPIWVMTGLAEGADLLAAEVVEELMREAPNWQLIPCLAMPITQMRNDFVNHRPRALFDYYSEYYNPIVLPTPFDDPEADHLALNEGPERDTLYYNQGVFLARYANVIIALWDGRTARGTGGTADVVNMQLGIITPCASLPSGIDGFNGGAVHHIPVSRASHDVHQTPKAELSSYSTSWQNKHQKGPTSHFPIYLCHAVSPSIEALQAQELTRLLDELALANTELCQVKAPQPTEQSSLYSPLFQRADRLSIQYRDRYRQCRTAFYLSSIAAYGCYEFISNKVGTQMSIVINLLIITLILAATLIRIVTKASKIKSSYQIYRGIAEAVRLRSYLNQAGIAPPSSTNLIPRRQRVQLTLFKQVLSVTELEWFITRPKPDLAAIKKNWINDQIRFFNTRLSRGGSLNRNPKQMYVLFENTARALFAMALVTCIILLFIQASGKVIWAQYGLGIAAWSLFTAGALTLWNRLAGYEHTSLGYEKLLALYLRARDVLEHHPEQTEHTLNELAKEAFWEHCEWTYYESQVQLSSR